MNQRPKITSYSFLKDKNNEIKNNVSDNTCRSIVLPGPMNQGHGNPAAAQSEYDLQLDLNG